MATRLVGTQPHRVEGFFKNLHVGLGVEVDQRKRLGLALDFRSKKEFYLPNLMVVVV